MITKEQKQIVLKYVDASYYDQDKIIKYLGMHDIVGNEIFAYCDRRTLRDDRPSYSAWLDDEYGYIPLSVSDFAKRIPFYFLYKRPEIYGSRQYGNTGLYIFGKLRKKRYRKHIH